MNSFRISLLAVLSIIFVASGGCSQLKKFYEGLPCAAGFAEKCPASPTAPDVQP